MKEEAAGKRRKHQCRRALPAKKEEKKEKAQNGDEEKEGIFLHAYRNQWKKNQKEKATAKK